MIHLTTGQLVSLLAGSGGLFGAAAVGLTKGYEVWRTARTARSEREQADAHHDEDHELEVRKVEFAEQTALMDSLRAQLAQQLSISQSYFADNQTLSLLVRDERERGRACEEREREWRESQGKVADLYRRLGLALARSAGHGRPGGADAEPGGRAQGEAS